MADRSISDQVERLCRRAEHVVSREDLTERLKEGKPLRVKLGLDPTAPAVTLGWAVPLRKLREFQDEGHTAVLIVGDFTARIGDPSGKNETRPQLTKEEVKAHAEVVLDQFSDILAPENLEVRYNSEWLEPMDLGDILKLTSHYTVAQMLERDDFAKRYAEQRPISIIEFMYPLAQAYDSVAVKADVELGGTDQLFNLLVGRNIQRAYGQREQICMTMPLLEGLDGVQKMSQSLNNYVAIRDEPAEMFGKLMSIPDGLVVRYGGLAANLSEEELKELDSQVKAGGPDAGQAKRRVARAVVALYHGPDAAKAAEEAFDRQFRRREAPEQVPEAAIPLDAIDGEIVYIPRVLAELGLASSRSEARRLLTQGGVKVNGEAVTSEEVRLADLKGALLQVGKRRFIRLIG
ncbi:MAG: tyrosyl-tRNA synthetase [Actinomycetota bacterium]|nr:tyrosyl-tRNA synthetase [Actinomycetota bacterium]